MIRIEFKLKDYNNRLEIFIYDKRNGTSYLAKPVTIEFDTRDEGKIIEPTIIIDGEDGQKIITDLYTLIKDKL